MDHDYLIEQLVYDDTQVRVLRLTGNITNNTMDCSRVITTGIMNWDEYPALSVNGTKFDLYDDIFSIALLHNGIVAITLFKEL